MWDTNNPISVGPVYAPSTGPYVPIFYNPLVLSLLISALCAGVAIYWWHVQRKENFTKHFHDSPAARICLLLLLVFASFVIADF